tara:strand:+ start:385 stop:1392 length:1008 start_codon:yes stop_codon:yes gene_type:complete
MSPLRNCILNKNTKAKPIWLMRQAGRYMPEFREIRKKNTNFIHLCLNEKLSYEITLQPIEKFDFDAAIIFSDILMVPYGLGQKVEFKKDFGPILGDLNINLISKINKKNFTESLQPIYNSIQKVSKYTNQKNKDLIGFVGAPWTLLVYMINKQSPKKNLDSKLFNNEKLINEILGILDKYIKLHIENQVKSGANIIQIFDSWAELVEDKNLEKFIYNPTSSLVKYTKSLGVPVICFPRNIKNYKKYVEEVKPDVINIDYNVDPKLIKENIDIVIQGGLDPKILLSDLENVKNESLRYLNLFKDRPYIFNLGHGVLPETDPNNVDYLVKLVKDFKC